MTQERVLAVTRQLAAAVHTGRWQPDELVSELRVVVPAEDAAWDALLEQPVRGSTLAEPVALTAAAAHLRWAIESTAVHDLETFEVALAQSIEDAAESRLFSVPMVALNGNAPDAGLLVLERWSERWAPAFQFEADGTITETVAEVNRLLDAESDPWGAASWWLLPHSSVSVIPADALRLGLGDEVLALAVAAGDLP